MIKNLFILKSKKQHFAKVYHNIVKASAGRMVAAASHNDEATLQGLMHGTYYEQEVQHEHQQHFDKVQHQAYLMEQDIKNMQDNINPWTREAADWVVPGPWSCDQCFYFDLETGEAEICELHSDDPGGDR